MANPANFKPTIERLLKRPTWAIGDGRALVGCMHKGGCDQVIDIELPKTLDEARARILAEGWICETHNNMHMCPKHGKEFYTQRTYRAQLTIQAKMNKAAAPKRGDLLSSAGYPKVGNSPEGEQKPNVSREWVPPMDALAAKPPESPADLHSPAASRSLRKMFTLLDDHFDVKRGRYVPGWSDQKVADECGLAVSAVVHYREGAYGVLRTIDEQTLREIKRLDAALNDLIAKMGLIRNDLAAIKGKVCD